MSEEPVIYFKDAQIAHNNNLVLTNVNLEISKGEFVYLIGKTGSGKTSLLRTLYGDLKLKSGTARVAGYQLNKLRIKQIARLRRKIGIVFQNFELLTDRNVNENLKFVMQATGWRDRKKMGAKMQNVLESVGLGTKGYKMPHELSGGEQQRVVIARALVNDPDVILADEPTGNLDPDTTNGILQLLFEISSRGKVVLMATHDHSTMKQFLSRTFKCQDESLIEVNAMTHKEY